MRIIIEKASLKDASALAGLKIDIWQNVYKNILPEEYLKTLTPEKKVTKYKVELEKNSSYEIYFLKLPTEIIGTFRIKYYQAEENINCISIEDLYLLPQYHNKGYGGLAIDFIYKRAIEKNCPVITAWIFESNTIVRKMAKKLGFIETQNIRTHSSTGSKLIQYYFNLEN